MAYQFKLSYFLSQTLGEKDLEALPVFLRELFWHGIHTHVLTRSFCIAMNVLAYAFLATICTLRYKKTVNHKQYFLFPVNLHAWRWFDPEFRVFSRHDSKKILWKKKNIVCQLKDPVPANAETKRRLNEMCNAAVCVILFERTFLSMGMLVQESLWKLPISRAG